MFVTKNFLYEVEFKMVSNDEHWQNNEEKIQSTFSIVNAKNILCNKDETQCHMISEQISLKIFIGGSNKLLGSANCHLKRIDILPKNTTKMIICCILLILPTVFNIVSNAFYNCCLVIKSSSDLNLMKIREFDCPNTTHERMLKNDSSVEKNVAMRV